MINECHIVSDLLPLYAEGMLSDPTTISVKEHLASCEKCRAELAEIEKGATLCQQAQIDPPVESAFTEAQKRLLRRMQFFFAMLLLPGILWGFGLMMGERLFYNAILMPLLGALGYAVFRKRAFYVMPVMLLITHLVFLLLQRWQEQEYLDLYSLLAWTLLCAFFAMIGSLFCWLVSAAIHWRRGSHPQLWRALFGSAAGLICIGLCLFANMAVGNPVSHALVTHAAEERLATVYGDRALVLEEVSYNFKDGDYYISVSDPNRLDGDFTMAYNMTGKLLWDRYDYAVEQGRNVHDRLYFNYRTRVDEILNSPLYPYHAEIAFGDLRDISDLESERFYDIDKLGAASGRLVLMIEDDTVSEERAAEILLETRRLFDEAGAGFYAVDLVLRYPKAEGQPRPEGRIELLGFLYSDITEEGLALRVQDANRAK